MSQQKANPSGFVETCLKKVNQDTGYRAAMTRADNLGTESQSWCYLVPFCDLENDYQRQAFGLVGAAIARVRSEKNGTQSLGKALTCCKNDSEDDSVERKLQRVLACDDSRELIHVLRSLVRFLTNQDRVSLDYVELLKDILYFNEKTKLRWATQYYRAAGFEIAGNEATDDEAAGDDTAGDEAAGNSGDDTAQPGDSPSADRTQEG